MSRRSDRDAAARRQYEAEHTRPSQGRSVIFYLTILVAAAFLLLVMAWFMQQRTADTVQGLHDSVNSVQTIDQLVVDNRALRQQLEALEEERDALQQELEAWKTKDDSSELKVKDRQLQALSTLNQLRALYNQGQYKAAGTLLRDNPTLEETLTELRATLSPAELEIYDPLAAYQKLAKLLGL